MSSYSERGTGSAGATEGYANRSDVTEPSGTVGGLSAPERVAQDNLEVDAQNPNIVRAIPPSQGARDETPGNTSQSTHEDEFDGIIEGSDSERTGTSWGLPGREENEVEIGATASPEGEGEGEVHPNRNTGERLTRDELENVGSWSTIDTKDSAGSPSGNS